MHPRGIAYSKGSPRTHPASNLTQASTLDNDRLPHTGSTPAAEEQVWLLSTSAGMREQTPSRDLTVEGRSPSLDLTELRDPQTFPGFTGELALLSHQRRLH